MIENDSKHTSPSSQLLRLRQSKTDINLEFKPLVQVDPSVLPSSRNPLKNPRVGDYQLKQTASTEGIASKKSLELKKRYLLGENMLATGIMKSDSTSILDTKLKKFHSNISDGQKLFNPSPDISPALQTFLKNTIASESDNFLVKTDNSSNVNQIGICEEKENVYKYIVNTKNELNKTEHTEAHKRKESENMEDLDEIFFKNTRQPSADPVETIDLVTPEKNKQIEHSAADDTKHRFDTPDDEIQIIQIQNCATLNNDVFIDLTTDTSLEHLPQTIEKYNVQDDSMREVEIKKTISDDHFFERRTGSNNISVSASQSLMRVESNSSKSSTNSSSSSSPAGISHHILESTTNTSADATPIESKELMQMDSLMIIDGKYTGDPEDLKLMNIPEIMKNEYKLTDSSAIQVATNMVTPTIKPYKYESIYKRPELKFDSRNENKIDSLRNLPLILPKQIDQIGVKATGGLTLNIGDKKDENTSSDNDRTPTVANPGNIVSKDCISIGDATIKSDSETETTGCICTETELSDWTADDAVSENFVDIEFALNSNRGTLKRSRRAKHKTPKLVVEFNLEEKNQCPIATCLDFDGIDFMDNGSEESCIETYAATNDVMLKNRGYVQFVNAGSPNLRTDYYRISSEKNNNENRGYEDEHVEQMPSVEFIEQGAFLPEKNMDLKTLDIETIKAPLSLSISKYESVELSSNEIEDESLAMISSQGGGNTTTEESEALTIVTSPGTIESGTIHASKRFPIDCSDVTGSELKNKSPDDLTYGDYVRQLQMAITQISNARDSIDIRKMKRKHSKCELYAVEPSKLLQTGQQHQSNSQLAPYTMMDKHNKSNNKSLSIYVGKVDEQAITVIEKLEEITKERAKQKDLIHDLVMNKLQSKKQLNAEKRLNRSRNRSSALSLSPSSNALPPPPPSSTATNNETISTQNRFTSSTESNLDNHRKANKTDDFNSKNILRGIQRPLSDNVDAYFDTPKLNKTKSFCAYEKNSNSQTDQQNRSPISTHHQSRFANNVNTFSAPLLPTRKNLENVLFQSTDELRQDARLRARLMSNQELGLSPDEKMNLLRKSYKSENAENATQSFSHQIVNEISKPMSQPNKSDDMKVRERKMLASKSVNDIAATNMALDCDNSSVGYHTTIDFKSDSNLHDDKPLKRRQKDPERRKSIIQAVSEFFHKRKDKEQLVSPKERNDSVFGLFRISPKAKSKVPANLYLFRNCNCIL